MSYEKLKYLQEDIRSCRQCKDSFDFEPHPIIFGHNQSKIMHISQAPSQNVYKTGKPFNDPSGKRLREDWYHISEKIFYNPDNFYIVSIAHCYPGKNPKGGDKLPPISCAKQWLTQILPLVDNKIYLLVGRIAADYFFPKCNFNELIFQDNELNDKPAYVLPHPSPLNLKWFKDNPDFMKYRVFEIQNTVHKVLNINEHSL